MLTDSVNDFITLAGNMLGDALPTDAKGTTGFQSKVSSKAALACAAVRTRPGGFIDDGGSAAADCEMLLCVCGPPWWYVSQLATFVNSGDPTVAELLERNQQGDINATPTLQQLFFDQHYKGLDIEALKNDNFVQAQKGIIQEDPVRA